MESDYLKWKKQAADDVESALDHTRKSKEKYRNIRDQTEEGLRRVKDREENLERLQMFIEAVPDDAKYDPSPEMNDYWGTFINLTEDACRLSEREFEATENVAWSFAQMVGTTTVAGATTASTDAVVYSISEEFSRTYLHDIPALRKATSSFSIPTEQEEGKALANRLGAIHTLLGEKLDEAFKAFQDNLWMSAAHAMREALSALGTELAPDEKVMQRLWFKQDPSTDGATQRQRLKYVILGTNDESKVSEEYLDAIEKLTKQGRQIYKSLSAEAHRRKGTWERERVRQFLAIGQNVVKEVLDLRVLFFAEE